MISVHSYQRLRLLVDGNYLTTKRTKVTKFEYLFPYASLTFVVFVPFAVNYFPGFAPFAPLRETFPLRRVVGVLLHIAFGQVAAPYPR